MRVRMKNLMGVMEGGSIPTLSNLEDAMKAEQKVPCLQLCMFTLIQTVSYKFKLVYDWWNSNRLLVWIQWFMGKLYSVTFDVFILSHELGSSWYCKKKEEIRVKKAVCRLSINKAKSSWFRGKELGTQIRGTARLFIICLQWRQSFWGFLRAEETHCILIMRTTLLRWSSCKVPM